MDNKKNIEMDVSTQALMGNCSVVNIESMVSKPQDNTEVSSTEEEIKIMKKQSKMSDNTHGLKR